jgi:putative oligomerization/nucleic acid binding protein
MKELTSEELQLNQQAVKVAASVLGEAVVAATRCEQATTDDMVGAAGVGAINRGLMKGMKSMSKVMMPSIGKMSTELEGGGLPGSFILAVTETQIHALEDKHSGGTLEVGKALKSWDRQGFMAKNSPSNLNATFGVPDDRQVVVLYLPIEGGNNKYLKAAAHNTAAAGSAGMPHKVALAKDAPSQAVIDAIVSTGGPTIMIGGTNLQDMIDQAAGATKAAEDPTEKLSKLADLHQRGVLTDDEFATQKAKILSEM